MRKPKVLILTDWYLPGFKAGGPIRSIQNLVSLLADQIDFSIITSDRDLMDTQAYQEVEIDTWVGQGNVKVFYASKTSRKTIIEQSMATDQYEIIYLNSFFSQGFTIEPILFARNKRILDRVVMAPRGMLGEGALKLKRSKKAFFIALFKLLKLHKKITFHATDRSEVVSIQRALGNQIRVQEIMNVPVQPDHQQSRTEFDRPSFIFASRISPKKNLLWLIERFRAIENPPQLSIYGEADDVSYEAKCKAAAKGLPITFHGALPPLELNKAFLSHQFFILPTLNENFGHAIIEALAHGCPAIISDQTPWNDLEEKGAGWVIPLSEELKWEEQIATCAAMKAEEVNAYSKRTNSYVSHKFDFDEIRKRYLNLFRA